MSIKKSIAVKIFAITLGLFITVIALHFLIFSAFFNQVYVGSMIRSYQNELRQAVSGYTRGGADTVNLSLRQYATEMNSPILAFDQKYHLADRGFTEHLSTITLRLESGDEVRMPINYLFSHISYPRLNISNQVRVSGVPLGNTGFWEPLILVYGDASWTNGDSYLRYGDLVSNPPERYPAVVIQTKYFSSNNDLLSSMAVIIYEQMKDCFVYQLEVDTYLKSIASLEITDAYGSQYRLFYETLDLGQNTYYFVTARRISFSGQEKRYISSLFVIIYGILAVLLTGSAYVLSKHISRPLGHLSRVTGKMAQLDFSEQVAIDGEDELGRMSDSINTLSRNLELALSAARTNEERIRTLLADLAHEFKTPLAIIAFYTELFEKGAYDKNPQEYYNIVDKQIETLTTMVNEAIELSRLQSGNWSINIDVCDLGDVVRTVLELFHTRLSSEGYSVVVEDLDMLVYADARRLEQVLSNFMSNAYKYCNDQKTIYLGWEARTEGLITVYVANSGSLSDSERDRIWARYYSTDSKINVRLPSEGIGLDIAKNILEAHSSQYGVGQKGDAVYFYFTLPLAESEQTEASPS